MKSAIISVIFALALFSFGCSQKNDGEKTFGGNKPGLNESVAPTQMESEDKTNPISAKSSGEDLKTKAVQSETEKMFPVPFFPERLKTILGKPLEYFSNSWSFACIYSLENMNENQRLFIKSLSQMSRPGEWGVFFAQDFDKDGNIETVNYGAFEDNTGRVGNFLLITRNKNGNIEKVLLTEFPDYGGWFACFYKLSESNTLLFGSGFIAGEMNWILEWTDAGPVITDLSD